MRVEQLLSETAARFGAKVAIVSGSARYSYADLDRKSDRLAAAFVSRGVCRGDHVAIFMDNSFAAIVATFATLKAGGVVAPINPGLDEDALAKLLGQRHAVAIVTEARLASVAAGAIAQVRSVRLVVLSGGDRTQASNSCLSFEDVVSRIGASFGARIVDGGEDPAIVLQPTGADGSLAPVTLTHEDLVAVASVAETLEDAVVVASVLISSHYSIYQLLTAIKVGATQVLETTGSRFALAG